MAGPALLHFGEVCVQSSSEKEMSIINSLDVFIHVVIKVCVFYRFVFVVGICIKDGRLSKIKNSYLNI